MDEGKMDSQKARLSRWHREFGEVATLMLQVPTYARYPIQALGIYIQPAIFHEQIAIVRDNREVPVGYATWAYLTDEVAQSCVSDPRRTLHFSEWTEGESLYIMDFLALPGWFNHVSRFLKNRIVPDEALIHWSRRKGEGTLRYTLRRR